MNLKKLLMTSVALASLSPGAWAEDVTDTYLKNAGFDTGSSWATASVAGISSGLAMQNVDNWTPYTTATNWTASAAVQIGSTVTVNGVTAPTTNLNGEATGGVLALGIGWGSEIGYDQSVTLPAGVYTMSYEVYNANSDSRGVEENLFGFVADNGTTFYHTGNTLFSYGEWKSFSFSFVLTEETKGKIRVGFKSITGAGSGSTAKIFVDNVKLTKEESSVSFNTFSKYIWVGTGNWSRPYSGGNFQVNSNTSCNGEYTGPFLEQWKPSVAFDGKASTSIENLPEGFYVFRAAAFGYLQSESAAKSMDLFLNNYSVSFLSSVLNYVEVPAYVSDGTATCGVDNKLNNWIGIGQYSASLSYYGNNDADLAAKCWEVRKSEVTDLLASKMKKSIEETLNTASSSFVTLTMEEKCKALKAIDEALLSVPEYAKVRALLDLTNAKAEQLDATGKTYYDTKIATYETAYTDGTIEAYTDVEDAIKDILLDAVKHQSDATNFTPMLYDASFENSLPVEWTDGLSCWAISRNTTGENDKRDFSRMTTNPSEGTYCLNMWAPQINYINVWQKVTLPAGKYQLSADARTNQVPLEDKTQVRAYINGSMVASSEGLTYNGRSDWNASDAWISLSATFNILESTEVEMGIYSNGKNVSGNQQGWYQVDKFRLVRLGDADTKYTRTVSNKFGSICLPHASNGINGIAKLYQVEEVSATTVTLKDVEVVDGAIAAGVPYLFQNSEDATEIEVTYAGNQVPDAVSNDYLVGLLSESVIPVGNYVLQNNVFKKVETESFKVAANRAYLNGDKVSAATTEASAALRINFGESTAIDAVEALTNGKAEIYDLNGRKLNGLQKGINIVNGVKVLVK